MPVRHFVRSVLRWLRRYELTGAQKGSSAVDLGVQPKPTEEFLRYRLQSLDKMLSDPDLSTNNRDLIQKMRSDLELELREAFGGRKSPQE